MPITMQGISASKAIKKISKRSQANNWCNVLQHYLEKGRYAKPIYSVESVGTPQEPKFLVTVTANNSPYKEQSAIGRGKTKKEARANAAYGLMQQFVELEKEEQGS